MDKSGKNKNYDQQINNATSSKNSLNTSEDDENQQKILSPNKEKDKSNRRENTETPIQSNSNNSTTNQEEDIQAKIIQKYKIFQEQTGCTNEELFDLVMDIETNDDHEEDSINIEDDIKELKYGTHDYWEQRYIESEEPFEWYFNWTHIEPLLSPYFKGKDLALVLGCGNSEMSYEIQKDDIKMVVSIDVSKTVIQQMTEKYKDNNNLLWYEMDCTDMGFKDDLFDVVFDKGTFDAILCGDNNLSNILMAMSEIWRVLKNNGFFIEISHSGPKFRMKMFKRSEENWKYFDPIEIKKNELGEEKFRPTYVYVFQKIEKEDENK